MLPEMDVQVWRDLVITSNTRVRRKDGGQEGIVLSPKAENDALLVWWGTSDNRAFINWVPVSELQEINLKEISCAVEMSELPSSNLEANAPGGQGELSNE